MSPAAPKPGKSLSAELVSPVTVPAGDDVVWRALNGYRVAARIGTAPPPALRLCDLTHVARTGFKGRGASDWLKQEGLGVPLAPNQVVVDQGGCVLARLGQEDFLVIDAVVGSAGLVERLEQRWSNLAGAGRRNGQRTPKQYSHALFFLGGAPAVEVLARLCALDLRPHTFTASALAQTMAAGIVVTILRYERGVLPGYLLLFDTSLAAYAWDVLVDAMSGYDGAVVGCEQLGAG